ncbi:MAG: hypothetical protein ACI4J5_01650 [Oscillospiraceae bacterium]
MRTITLHKDYYNDITAEELDGLNSIGRSMLKFETNYMVVLFLSVVFEIYVLSRFIIRVKNTGFSNLLKSDALSVMDALGTLAVIVLLIISFVFGVYEYRKWKYFFFGKGEIISVRNEHIEPNKKYPEGYYRNILTIAVSEEEAVCVYYLSNTLMDEEYYIGRKAIAVYYPYLHIRFAVMSGENPTEYMGRYGGAVMDRKNRGRSIE